MPQNPIETVEIVEPPIGELTKKHGGLKRGCFTGCGCIVLFLIGIIVAIRLFIGSGPETIKNIPNNFPKDIPVYDRDNIDSITYISGTYKSRSMEIAGLFPKFILSPVLLKLGNETGTTQEPSNQNTLQKLWTILTTPVGDSRDTVHIEWQTISADPSFVLSYYKTELRKQGYTIADSNSTPEVSFEKNTITGSVNAQKHTDDPGGSVEVVLTVNYPTVPGTTTLYHAP